MVDRSDRDPVGYRQPPTSTQLRKGKSGNPNGRPRGRKVEALYEAVLGRLVTVRERGVERRVRADEAFLLYMINQGLKGDTASNRAILEAIERAYALHHGDLDRSRPLAVISTDCLADLLQDLHFGTKYHPFKPTTYMKLHPWIVQAALDRMGEHRLTVEEQDVVINATRTLQKVRWPDWWEVTEPDPDHHRKYCKAIQPACDVPDAYSYYYRKPSFGPQRAGA